MTRRTGHGTIAVKYTFHFQQIKRLFIIKTSSTGWNETFIRVEDVEFPTYPLSLSSGVVADVSVVLERDISDTVAMRVQIASVRTLAFVFDYDVKGKFRTRSLCEYNKRHPGNPLCRLFSRRDGDGDYDGDEEDDDEVRCKCPIRKGRYSRKIYFKPPQDWRTPVSLCLCV